MLDICTTNAICEQIHTSKYFSIECDEVTSHKKAFMSIILRYVTDFHIQERCLKLVPVSSLTGRSLADVILSVLSDHNLPLMDLIGKGFDGAANMSGKDEGVQQHLFEAGAQLSVYFHCFAHRLNLVLEHSVENVTTIKTVFDAIGDIYRFMDGSPKRHALYKEHVKKQEITSGKTALHSLSDTRWTAGSDNLDVIINVYPALLSMFKQMSNEGNGTAAGLLFRIKQFDFVSACLVLQKCFSLSRHASEYLQSEEMDLVTAVVAIQDLTSTYEAMRSQEEFNKLISNSLFFARENQSTLSTTETVTPAKRRRCLPSRFRDGQTIIMGSNSLPWSHPEGDSVADRLRQNFFHPFLDRLLAELKQRFSDQACELISDAAVFYPQHMSPTNMHKVENLAKFYNFDEEQVGQQYLLFSQSVICQNWKLDYDKHQKSLTKTGWISLPTLLKVFGENHLQHLYKDLFRIIAIVATLPVTVASCERTHSKVKLINNYLRTATSSERLEDLVEISCERDIADNIELHRLVEAFKLASERKIKL